MKEANYVRDALHLLLDQGREARDRHANVPADDVAAREFEAGRTMAYYEVLGTLVGQLRVFEIADSDVGWDMSRSLEDELLGGLGAPRHGA